MSRPIKKGMPTKHHPTKRPRGENKPKTPPKINKKHKKHKGDNQFLSLDLKEWNIYQSESVVSLPTDFMLKLEQDPENFLDNDISLVADAIDYFNNNGLGFDHRLLQEIYKSFNGTYMFNEHEYDKSKIVGLVLDSKIIYHKETKTYSIVNLFALKKSLTTHLDLNLFYVSMGIMSKTYSFDDMSILFGMDIATQSGKFFELSVVTHPAYANAKPSHKVTTDRDELLIPINLIPSYFEYDEIQQKGFKDEPFDYIPPAEFFKLPIVSV